MLLIPVSIWGIGGSIGPSHKNKLEELLRPAHVRLDMSQIQSDMPMGPSSWVLKKGGNSGYATESPLPKEDMDALLQVSI